MKFGALIINQLAIYDQPIFVYLMPFAELLGGAWIVFDSNINPNYIETYVDKDSKAAILETEAIMAVKYKKSDVITLMHRLDIKLIELDSMLKDLANIQSFNELKSEIILREDLMFPVYQKV